MSSQVANWVRLRRKSSAARSMRDRPMADGLDLSLGRLHAALARSTARFSSMHDGSRSATRRETVAC